MGVKKDRKQTAKSSETQAPSCSSCIGSPLSPPSPRFYRNYSVKITAELSKIMNDKTERQAIEKESALKVKNIKRMK